MSDERQFFRFGVCVDVEVEFPNGDSCLLKTENLSEGGIFLKINGLTIPPLGTQLFVQVKQLGDDESPQRIKVQVMHCTEYGVGLQFIEQT